LAVAVGEERQIVRRKQEAMAEMALEQERKMAKRE
jgi:uncharacterized protein (UPF0261 family)